jgi:serine/threonine protein kinase
MFYEGRQIGSYTLLQKLGKGGFGEVWLAEKRSQFVTKRVAVKLPLDEQVNFDAIRQEAGLWEQASGHPNVLPIIDADIVDGQVVIVSEYADGGSLADRLKREGKLPLQKAVEMTIGILNGLEFLHSRKIIHRDIKPQNILLQGDTPRLADFGISRAMNTTVVSSAIIGTDAYMSPESFDGKRTIQTDIWSVGIVLYALLADCLPFPQEHPSERMFAILTKEFAPLPPDVPPQLQRIVYRALAKQPENRYQTTTEMRDELQKVLIGIAHPTLAPTEVFRIPTENLPTIPTLENRYETGEAEKETVVSPQNINIPAPTQMSYQPESIVTNFKETPPATNNPAFSNTQEANKQPAAQFQMYGKPLPSKPQKTFDSPASSLGKNKELKYFLVVIGGLFVILIIALAINSSRNRASNSNMANNVNRDYVALGVSFPINVELKAKSGVSLDIYVDGKYESTYLSSSSEKRFTASQSFMLAFRKDSRDDIQLKIDGINIVLPDSSSITDPFIRFEITKDNYNRALQTTGNINQLKVNINAAYVNSSSYNSNANANSNTASTTEMKIEMESTKENAALLYVLDGERSAVYLDAGEVKEFNPQKEIGLIYHKVNANSFIMRINGKTISIPTVPNVENSIQFYIKKENIDRILQAGKVSDSEGM